MRVLITNGYIVYYFNVVAFKTEIYDDEDDDETLLPRKRPPSSCFHRQIVITKTKFDNISSDNNSDKHR